MFVFYRQWCILATVFLLSALLVKGHSVNNRRLTRIEPLTNVKVDIAPRPYTFYSKRDLDINPFHNHTGKATTIEHDDILRLRFDAYNQTFALHLEPNQDLLHPQAAFMYGGKPEPIQANQFHIYRGHVIHPSFSLAKWQDDQLGTLSFDGDDILGWARLILRQDLTTTKPGPDEDQQIYPIFEGSFGIRNDVYHIKTMDMYYRTKRSDDVTLTVDNYLESPSMVVYRDSDTSLVGQQQGNALNRRSTNSTLNQQQQSGCGADRLGIMTLQQQQQLHNPFILRAGHPAAGLDGLFVPPSSFSSLDDHHPPSLNKRAANGCPTSRKIAYMGAAADCTYTKYYESKQQAQLQIISDWNSVSALFERQFNIQLGLVNITIMDESCPSTPVSNYAWNRDCSDTYTLDNRLSDFSRWRGTMSDDGIALWHLLTNCATGVEVGIAWVGQLCQAETNSQATSTGGTQYVAGAGVSSIIRDEWKVIAHEIGHGFGANHDCTTGNCQCTGSDCNCCPLSASVCDAGGTYIMNPTSNVSAQEFSPCSVTTICNTFPSIGSCLQDPGHRTIETLQMCGNGIVEQGEECDPGSHSSSCCDATTCKFINNAVCDDVNDSCCNQCQYQPSTHQCRPAYTSCDIPEYCTGSSGACPPDLFTADGTDCGGNLKCASGQCTSRDLQCQHRGFTLNVTKSCTNSNSCSLSCNKNSGSGCLVFSGGMIDGTPCGANGYCRDGDCDEGSLSDRALYWLSTHQNIAIPVGVVIGILIFGSLAWCCYTGCCGHGGWRNRNIKKHQRTTMTGTAPPMETSLTSTTIMSPPPSHYYGNNRVSSPPLDSSQHLHKNGNDSGHVASNTLPPATSPSLPPPPPIHQHSS
ncbi:Metallo-peptidase family M12-domain-containing protein [Chlamydoabsidia padenii]|nr:Metallo-peptidase family M12-domain-containing protein [Chlamydoabsidia padenii]